jgi:Sec-independent protein translocase protein TatA
LAAPAPLAFVSTTELIVVAVVGLLLFGGDLPKLLRDLGKVWVKLRRAANEFKREAGIDQTVEEIRRATDFRIEEPRWRREMDHAAGPARDAAAQEAQVNPAEPEPPATPAADPVLPAQPAADTPAPDSKAS